MIGKVISGRYEILELIGKGGMANVYRARDLNLGREVAVKMLHESFASDKDFRERFRREARAASVLSSPYIVQVYDFCESDQGIYIVMELVRGEDLRSLLERCGRLSLDQAIGIALDVLSALQVAHDHGLVHRDVSARNVLIGTDDSVKVSDFGIARVLGERTLTQAGELVGSVQYISPEQARGDEAEFRSDVYSVGVLLYQMLTGCLPFNADNAVKLALKHMQENASPPSLLRPEISGALDDIVLCALAKDPEDRFESAQAMSDALNSLRYSPEDEEADGDYYDEYATAVRPTGWSDEEQPDYFEDSTSDLPSDEVDFAESEHGQAPKKRSRVGLMVGLLLTVFVAVVAGITWAFVFSVPRTAVANVEGDPIDIATATLESLGFKVNIEEQRAADGVPEGIVISQTPKSGTSLAKGSVIYLVVSRSKDSIFLPNFDGLTIDQALKELDALGLSVDVIKTDDPTAPAGMVVGQDPSVGTKVARGSQVRLTVGSSEGAFELPKLMGMSSDEAADVVTKMGGVVVISEDEGSGNEPPNTVVKQDPPAGTRIKRGSKVQLWIRKGGKVTSVMPRLVGKTVKEAMAEAEALGINLAIEGGGEGNCRVSDQKPAAGSIIENGKAVAYSFPETVVPDVSGKLYEAAVAELNAANLKVGNVTTSAEGGVPGQVLEQHPVAGIEAERGSAVDLIIGAEVAQPHVQSVPRQEEYPQDPVYSAPPEPNPVSAPAPANPATHPAEPMPSEPVPHSVPLGGGNENNPVPAPATPALDIPGDLPI